MLSFAYTSNDPQLYVSCGGVQCPVYYTPFSLNLLDLYPGHPGIWSRVTISMKQLRFSDPRHSIPAIRQIHRSYLSNDTAKVLQVTQKQPRASIGCGRSWGWKGAALQLQPPLPLWREPPRTLPRTRVKQEKSFPISKFEALS